VSRIANVFHEVIESGNDELPILSVSIHHGVSDNEIADEDMDRKVTRSDDRSKYKRVAPGDLVYNMMRAWQGGFGTVTVEGMVSPAYVVARPKRNLTTAYIEHLLRTPQAIEQMRRHSRGIQAVYRVGGKSGNRACAMWSLDMSVETETESLARRDRGPKKMNSTVSKSK
jgi:type I restriction enzyme S subunit